MKWFSTEQQLSKILGKEVELISNNALSPYIKESVNNDMVIIYDERNAQA